MDAIVTKILWKNLWPSIMISKTLPPLELIRCVPLRIYSLLKTVRSRNSKYSPDFKGGRRINRKVTGQGMLIVEMDKGY